MLNSQNLSLLLSREGKQTLLSAKVPGTRTYVKCEAHSLKVVGVKFITRLEGVIRFLAPKRAFES